MRHAFALAFLAVAAHAAADATFDDLALAPNSYENGRDLNGGFTSGNVGFSNTFTDYGGGFTGWEGFAYSNVDDATTVGFGNQYAAIAGTAHSGSNYGVSFGDATLRLAPGTAIQGLFITNTTYAALSMQNGDSFAKKFGGPTGNDPDSFSVVATGYANGAKTGSAEFFLADYRFADNSRDYIVRDWRWFDLTGLGSATEVRFAYTSTDTGSFGINTPTYFALDDVRTTQVVPEPASMAALALGLVALVRRRAR